jgi:hypothetical protein
VAATRTREELHLFARPSYKIAPDGSLSLVEPRDSLLATAWPALEDEIRKRFVEWRQETSQRELEGSEPEEITIQSLAASSESNVLGMPIPIKPTPMRRLPPDYRPAPTEGSSVRVDEPLIGAGRLYERHEGGLLSRALGIAVHSLLQQLAHLLATQPWNAARATLTQMQPRIVATIRSAGIDPELASRIAARAFEIVLKTAGDPLAQWILAPHAEAANEVRWTGLVGGSLRTVQVDRVFRAGPAPRTAGDSADQNTWWIIDYKAAHEDGLDPDAALPELREIFAPQIEAYAKVLRNLRGQDTNLCGGLYYPRMSRLDWWQL